VEESQEPNEYRIRFVLASRRAAIEADALHSMLSPARLAHRRIMAQPRARRS
jgi:hypothetical protein